MQYPKRKDHLALDGLNLCIAGGQVNAITGTSGGGKSSKPVMTVYPKDPIAKSFFNSAILALLQRFYDPSHRTITVGGIDLQMIPLETLQSNLAIVSQDSVLFEGDIRFNLSVSLGL
jgi:ATP-binding cassette subfamily B (MDR/TAP) protein 1